MSVRFRHLGFKQNSILATLNEDVCENYWGGAYCDRKGVTGPSGEVEGLGLLPISTEFMPTKQVCQVQAIWQTEQSRDQ
jgi:hypothetical protein